MYYSFWYLKKSEKSTYPTVEYTDCFSAEWSNSPNEIPGYDTKQSDGEVPVKQEVGGMWSTPFIANATRFTLSRSDNTWYSPIYGSNRTKLLTYAKLNWMKGNYFCMLNWIVWNWTVFDIETALTLNWIVWIRTVWLYWIAWNRNIFDN